MLQDNLSEIKGKITFYKNAINSSKEVIDQNAGFLNALTEDGYITIGANSPVTAMVTTENNNYYVVIKEKGVAANTLNVFGGYSFINRALTEQKTILRTFYDENSNLEKIQINSSTANSLVYLTYSYAPKLYYENIIKSY